MKILVNQVCAIDKIWIKGPQELALTTLGFPASYPVGLAERGVFTPCRVDRKSVV